MNCKLQNRVGWSGLNEVRVIDYDSLEWGICLWDGRWRVLRRDQSQSVGQRDMACWSYVGWRFGNWFVFSPVFIEGYVKFVIKKQDIVISLRVPGHVSMIQNDLSHKCKQLMDITLCNHQINLQYIKEWKSTFEPWIIVTSRNHPGKLWYIKH